MFICTQPSPHGSALQLELPHSALASRLRPSARIATLSPRLTAPPFSSNCHTQPSPHGSALQLELPRLRAMRSRPVTPTGTPTRYTEAQSWGGRNVPSSAAILGSSPELPPDSPTCSVYRHDTGCRDRRGTGHG